MRMIAANVVGLVYGVGTLATGFLFLANGSSPDAVWAGVLFGVAGVLFLMYAITVLTAIDGVLYAGPFRGRWKPHEVEAVELVPLPGLRSAEQLAVVVHGRARVITNVTSRPIGDDFTLAWLRRELQAGWVEGSKAPKLPRFWLCY